MFQSLTERTQSVPWNKGKLCGQKRPLKLQEVWSIRFRLELDKRTRDLAMFNLAIDSKLRACDLMALRVADIAQGKRVQPRARIIQRKTGRPVQFEITEQTRIAVEEWIAKAHLGPPDFLFPSRVLKTSHLSRRQYGRIVNQWVSGIGNRIGPIPIWHPLSPKNEGVSHLSQDSESPRCSTSARSYEPGEHRSLPGDR